jgi:hypothetical protein
VCMWWKVRSFKAAEGAGSPWQHKWVGRDDRRVRVLAPTFFSSAKSSLSKF